MKEFSRLTMQEEAAREKAAFHAQYLRTRVYEFLNSMRPSDPGRLSRLEDACWRFRCAAIRNELKGARARRALSLLLRLKAELQEPAGLPEQIPPALDALQDQLQRLASKRPEGRPRDGLGQAFRRNIEVFLTPFVVRRSGCRSLSREELHEVLSELFMVAIGRALSPDSYIRMRKREKAAAYRAFDAGRREHSGRKTNRARHQAQRG